MEEIYVLGEKK